MAMDERDVIDLLARIMIEGRRRTAIGFALDEINQEIDREKSSSSINARRSTGRRRGVRGSEQRKAASKRKVSAYQREFGRQLKKLKKKHPRTKISTLMKKAHRATKKVRK
jgi:hypothetical protein